MSGSIRSRVMAGVGDLLNDGRGSLALALLEWCYGGRFFGWHVCKSARRITLAVGRQITSSHDRCLTNLFSLKLDRLLLLLPCLEWVIDPRRKVVKVGTGHGLSHRRS